MSFICRLKKYFWSIIKLDILGEEKQQRGNIVQGDEYLKELIVYFCDNVVHIVYKREVISKKLDSISRGLVVNRTSFMESFLEILKKEKIKSKLFGDKIYIVKDVYLKPSDLFYLESIFADLGFIKVVFLDIKEYFNEDYTYIGIFQDYMVFYLDNSVFIDLKYFKDFPKLIEYFKDYYQKFVLLFGTNKNIPNIHSNLVYIYYIDDFQNYITQSLLKVKKYDV